MAVPLKKRDLRHRVTIQTRTEVSDGHDGLTETWADVTTRRRVAAKVIPLRGRDLERAKQVDPRITHEVTLLYWRGYRDVLDGGRARLIYHPSWDDDRTLDIVAPPIDIDEAHVAIAIMCKEAA